MVKARRAGESKTSTKPTCVYGNIAQLAERFGLLANALADSLTLFSLDVVGIVCGFALCVRPTSSLVPRTLAHLAAGSLAKGSSGVIACAPNDNAWLCSQYLQVVVNGCSLTNLIVRGYTGLATMSASTNSTATPSSFITTRCSFATRRAVKAFAHSSLSTA